MGELSQMIHELTQSKDSAYKALAIANNTKERLHREVEHQRKQLQSSHQHQLDYQIDNTKLESTNVRLTEFNKRLSQKNTAFKLQETINEDQLKTLTDNLTASRLEINWLTLKVSNQTNQIRNLKNRCEKDRQVLHQLYISHQSNANASKELKNLAAMNATLRQELEIMKQVTSDNECSVCFEPVSSFMLFINESS